MAGSSRHHRRGRHGFDHLRGFAGCERSRSAAKDDARNMNKTVKTAVVGVTGYAGAELARLLLHHPRLKNNPPVFAGRVDAKDLAHGGVPLTEILPQLGDNAGAANLKLEPFSLELLSTLGVEVDRKS